MFSCQALATLPTVELTDFYGAQWSKIQFRVEASVARRPPTDPDLKISLIRFLGSDSFYQIISQTGDTPSPGLPADFTTDLPAKLWDFLNLSVMAIHELREVTLWSPDHSLSNIIEFQRIESHPNYSDLSRHDERLVMRSFSHPEELVSADKFALPQDCSWHAKDPNPAANPTRNPLTYPTHETAAKQYPE